MLTINKPAVPSERDMMMARESQRQLGGVELAAGESVMLQIGGKSIAVPAGVAAVVGELIRRMAEGKAVAVVPLEEEVSPQEAAELLGVSRPYAAKLFDQGAIPSRRVGTHRRALIGDVLAYRQREKEARCGRSTNSARKASGWAWDTDGSRSDSAAGCLRAPYPSQTPPKSWLSIWAL